MTRLLTQLLTTFLCGAFSLTVLAQISLTDEERSYLHSKQKITMCIDPAWMPLEKIEKGKHIGMTADYIAILQKKIGVPIELVPTVSWTQSIEYAKARKCDIFSLAMPTEERLTYMDFTRPYLTIPLVLATKMDKFFVVDISKLEGKKLGVVKGYAFGEILRKKFPGLTIVDVDSLYDGLEKVNHGELYGFIGTLVTIGYESQRNFVGEIKIAGKFDEQWQLGVATRNDEPLLKNIFDKAIADISEKQKQDILNQWLSIRYEQVVNYRDLWPWLILSAVVLMFILYRFYVLRKYNEQLQRLTITDNLTQIYNRLKLDAELEQQANLYDRYKQPFSIMIIDIDLFKQVNDRYGHQSGDVVLVEFTQVIKKHIRKTDIFGRWGGEEFMLIIPNTDIHKAMIQAEKLRLLIAKHNFKIVGHLTASFGVAQFDEENNTIKQLISKADRALYQAKDQGRNRVVRL